MHSPQLKQRAVTWRRSWQNQQRKWNCGLDVRLPARWTDFQNNERRKLQREEQILGTHQKSKPRPCKTLYFITLLPQKKKRGSGRASEHSAGSTVGCTISRAPHGHWLDPWRGTKCYYCGGLLNVWGKYTSIANRQHTHTHTHTTGDSLNTVTELLNTAVILKWRSNRLFCVKSQLSDILYERLIVISKRCIFLLTTFIWQKSDSWSK